MNWKVSRRTLGFPLAVALLAAPALAETPSVPIPVHVAGRVLVEPDGSMSFGWPGVYFEGRFRGTAVRVRVEASREHMRLLVDGEEKMIFREPGTADVTISGLAAGGHVVRLEKQTESQSGGGRFLGFFAPGGTPLPAQARQRRIEFIGDSYTVGYGNTSAARECSQEEIHDRTDTQQAFPALVGRKLDADYRILAYSGFGIVRNYAGGQPTLSLPIIYPRLKPDTPAPVQQDPGEWRPQWIVINLGTNDFSTPLKPGERWSSDAALRADYRNAYATFVSSISARQPQARFILMGSDDFIGDVRQVALDLNRAKPGLATPLHFNGLELTGCDWHPSLADNARLAELVAATIERLPPTN